MLSFLHPGFLYAAIAAAAGIVALHFIITEQPRTGVLPTVRFFPDLPARASTLTLRLSDILLLALRVTTVLLIGAAFAQPRITPTHHTVTCVVGINVPSASPRAKEAADSTLLYIGDAAAVIRDSSGSLSSLLVSALRAGARVRESADSIELVLISQFTTNERDAATLAIRSRWPGRIRVVRIPPDTTHQPARQQLRVEWADSVAGSLWARRARVDTVGAVAVGATSVLIYPFVRRWRLAVQPGKDVRIVARWVDGEPAIVESVAGGTCLRSVSFTPPVVGDAILRWDFVRFGEYVRTSCGAATPTLLPPEFVAALEGPAHLAASSAIAPRVTRMTPLVPWLLGAAILLALLELALRRQRRADAASNEGTPGLDRAA